MGVEKSSEGDLITWQNEEFILFFIFDLQMNSRSSASQVIDSFSKSFQWFPTTFCFLFAFVVLFFFSRQFLLQAVNQVISFD
jgi:hypothetical protein